MGSTKELKQFRALTFDCYGTLIDWESGIWNSLQPLLDANDHTVVTRPEALGAFSICESEQEALTPDAPYPEILARVHEALAARLDLKTTAALDERFGSSVGDWPAFDDSVEALRYLKTRYKIVILSNVHREGIQRSIQKLGVVFDAVYTAEDIGSYKPSPRNFEYMLDHLKQDLELDHADILHTAQSLYHDHAPARALGLANAWIDRQRLSEGGDWGATKKLAEPPETDFTFFSLEELAAALRAELG